MLRSRTIREGSVGLLIVTGILLFGAVALWLRGIKLGESTYEIIAEFPNVNGVQVGDGVRYRGLKVGRIKEIVPATNGVDVVMEIDSSQLLIPRNVEITTSSSGLIGETFIDIRPPANPVTFNDSQLNPMGNDCDPQLILCDGEKLAGVPGITIDDLFPLMYQLTSRLADNPELFDNVGSAAKNAAVAAAEITKLSQDVSLLVTDVQSELNSFTDAAKAVSTVAGDASGQINATALKYQETATKLSELVDNANQLVSQNRNNLTTTLDSISQTSDRLQGLIVKLDATVAETDTTRLVNNLETLTANAADASANLKEISATFADPNSVVALQQTLDSARVTFANAQKITADLEEVTGDPSFRTNIRNLVNGLSNLVSYTETLEQQIYTDRVFQDLQQFSTANSDLLKLKKLSPNLQKQAKP
jgi:phospholipid/cholesterol/gamma-HCH transport system substrate-binding protein